MTPLNQCTAGTDCEIAAFAPELPHELHQHLLAWGLLPGVTLRVIDQRPTTRVLVEHTELALEHGVAAMIHTQSISR
jgi:Fe2+ transport system protein FeoA